MTDWHTLDVRVYFEDTDAQGVVYFANFLKFMERGRTEWLRELGVEQDWLLDKHGVCFALTRTEAKFLLPARFNDLVQIRTRVGEYGRVRIGLEQTVSRAGELLCSAQCTAACIDAESFRPRRIPEQVAARLTAAAGLGSA